MIIRATARILPGARLGGTLKTLLLSATGMGYVKWFFIDFAQSKSLYLRGLATQYPISDASRYAQYCGQYRSVLLLPAEGPCSALWFFGGLVAFTFLTWRLEPCCTSELINTPGS